MEDHRLAMVAWKVVCRPKDQGGLGIINLNVQNKALLLKNLHQFLTDRIFLGSISFGKVTMQMASCLDNNCKDLSGRKLI